MKSPALAACLSFLCGGLGQLYCGRIGRGLAIMLAPALLVLVIVLGGFPHPGLVIALYATLLAFWVWQLVDAYRCAERSNQGLTRTPRGRRRGSGRRRRTRRKRVPLS